MLRRHPIPPDRSTPIMRLIVLVEFICTVGSMTMIGVLPYLGLFSNGTHYAQISAASPLLFLLAQFLTAIILSVYRHPIARGAWRLFGIAIVWILLVALSMPAIT